METKKPEKERLAEVINEIFNAKQNTKTRKLFAEHVKDLKPAACQVRIGWRSGKEIGFNCLFEKNGTDDVFDAVEKGIENADEIKYFIYGLNPKKFQFLPETFVDELYPGKCFLIFKLIGNETRKRKKQVR